MRKFKRAAVLGATILAFSGAAAGVSQAADHTSETPGNYKTDCNKEQLAKELEMGNGGPVVVDRCTQAPSADTMIVHWHDA
ncbi:hypothetical protein [Streptomyces daliensis]|uniref:Uncharacterized protein n=1 Tax=Streptomyces daliensis TaxID=299421 RepID=A0A8T4J067_9ACTN|nr:hypothetical protein [Streptomyces daliensis]